jgi:predicted kinase
MNQRELYLIRGISGSGKSTLAREIKTDLALVGRKVEIVEADMFHLEEGGIYKFVGDRIGDAHLWCRLQADRLLRYNGVVIVSNTFTTLKELIPYFELAAKQGAKVIIKEPSTPWKKDANQCWMYNTHNVPVEVLQAQMNRWVDIPQGIYEPKDFLLKYNALPV